MDLAGCLSAYLKFVPDMPVAPAICVARSNSSVHQNKALRFRLRSSKADVGAPR